MLEFDVWFNNGLLRAFPKVDVEKIISDKDKIAFIYGDERREVFINLDNVNCIERVMKED